MAEKNSSSRLNWLRVSSGLLLTVLLSLLAWWITRKVYALTLPLGIPGKVLEYPIWAALLGILGNLLLRPFKGHEFIRPGIRMEFFLKTGLVLLGTSINLKLLATAAGGAVLQAPIMIASVFFFTYWLAGVFGIDDKLRAVMSTALSVCGVSAAIAAAGSVKAKKEQVTYVVTLVILVALPLMVLAPLAARAMHLTDAVAGAWFGGNIDTTAAVVGAGTIFSDAAQKMASIVKNTQNALIGVVAFLLALYFAVKKEGSERPSARMIWDRFPKFVLGFIVASILYTLGQVYGGPLALIDGGKGTVLEALKNWAFTLAFVSMGLEFAFAELKSMGWKPVAVFLIATLFNTLLALGVSWVIFTYLLPVTF
ncbi:MAG TPA: putative sulfate exporter family transporter [Anaerolineales bacterium]|nr:putative sulfate exporter family transporter [Anaerolineales bacterium]